MIEFIWLLLSSAFAIAAAYCWQRWQYAELELTRSQRLFRVSTARADMWQDMAMEALAEYAPEPSRSRAKWLREQLSCDERARIDKARRSLETLVALDQEDQNQGDAMRGRRIKLKNGTALVVEPNKMLTTGKQVIVLREENNASNYYLTRAEANALRVALGSAILHHERKTQGGK